MLREHRNDDSINVLYFICSRAGREYIYNKKAVNLAFGNKCAMVHTALLNGRATYASALPSRCTIVGICRGPQNKSGKPVFIGFTALGANGQLTILFFNLALLLSMGTLQINLSHSLSLLLTLSVQNSWTYYPSILHQDPALKLLG